MNGINRGVQTPNDTMMYILQACLQAGDRLKSRMAQYIQDSDLII